MSSPSHTVPNSSQFPGDGEVCIPQATANGSGSANTSKTFTWVNGDATKNTFLVGFIAGYQGGTLTGVNVTVDDGTTTWITTGLKDPATHIEFLPARPIFWGKGKNIVLTLPAGGTNVVGSGTILAYAI